MNAVTQVVEALDACGCRPKRQGSGWKALCPAHDDHQPSLAVSEGEVQPVVVHCHAGCSSEDVLGALGLSIRDLCDPPKSAPKRTANKKRTKTPTRPTTQPVDLDEQTTRWAAELWEDPYRDRLDILSEKRGLSDKVIVRAQLGFDGERFTIPVFDRDAHTIYVKRYLPDGNPKMLLPKGSKAALYGMETLRTVDAGTVVMVTEGELDVLLCRSLGYRAVSGTTGAGTWLDEWSEALAPFEVVLAGDHDRAGREFNRKAAKSLTAAGGHAVTLQWPAGTPEKTDVTDFIVTQGHEPAELQKLIDAALESGRLRSLDLGRFLTETIEPIPWIIPGWLAERDIVCLAGEPKLGKSLIALEAGVSLARSSRVLQHLNVRNGPHRVLYVDEENNPRLIRYRVRKLARGLGLSADDLANLPLRYLSENALNLDDDGRLQALFREARRFRPDLVILDSLVRIHRRDENSNAAMSGLFTGAIKPLATHFDCAVLMLHHMAKPSKDRAGGSSHRVRGASDITAQVDQLWLLERAKSGDLRLKHSMSRWAETSPTLSVTIEDVEDGDGLRIVAQEGNVVAESTILEFLEEREDVGALRQKIITELESRGYKSEERMASNALSKLHSEGTLRKKREGVPVRYWIAEYAPEDAE